MRNGMLCRMLAAGKGYRCGLLDDFSDFWQRANNGIVKIFRATSRFLSVFR